MLELKKISKEDLDDTFEEFIYSEKSDYQLSKQAPTHFTMEKVKEGRYKGFDKVKYFTKIKLLLPFLFHIFRM